MNTADATTTLISEKAWESIQGAYDLQVHVAPDVIERRTDDIDLAKDFLARGLRGFVLKSHYIPTAERAQVVTKAVPGIEAYGAVTLNHSVGGLNPVALEIAGRSGNKIVWMPTVDAANETAGRLDGGNQKLPFWAKIQREIAAAGITRPPMTVLDGDGKISDETRQCLEL
ncbi:MAG: cytosolic protein, partial [Blastocatellia bacterium]|nr:cytosolic protein [Blastocatellia bacterium]